MSGLTLLNLGFEYADITERARSTSDDVDGSHTDIETRHRLLKEIIMPLQAYANLRIFQTLIARAYSLVSSGHLRDAREVEVMLLAHSYVSALTFVDKNSITLTEHRGTASLKICVRIISGQSQYWSILTCRGLWTPGAIQNAGIQLTGYSASSLCWKDHRSPYPRL